MHSSCNSQLKDENCKSKFYSSLSTVIEEHFDKKDNWKRLIIHSRYTDTERFDLGVAIVHGRTGSSGDHRGSLESWDVSHSIRFCRKWSTRYPIYGDMRLASFLEPTHRHPFLNAILEVSVALSSFESALCSSEITTEIIDFFSVFNLRYRHTYIVMTICFYKRPKYVENVEGPLSLSNSRPYFHQAQHQTVDIPYNINFENVISNRSMPVRYHRSIALIHF